MDLPYELLLLAAGLVMASPTLKRRLEASASRRVTQKLWTEVGVAAPEVSDHENAWGQAPEGPAELKLWMDRLEVPASRALDWRRLGLDLRLALAWKTRGFTPLDVNAWSGFTTINADGWRRVGFTPGQARSWIAETFAEPREAANWSSGGLLKPHEAKRWKNDGFAAGDALKWIMSGLADPQQAHEWLALNIGADEFPDWLFATPATAAMWKSRGFDGDAASEWAVAGLTPDEAVGWKSIGVGSGEVHAWLAWTSFAVAREWKRSGVDSPYVARTWFALGFEPVEASRWINGSSVPPNLAVTWVGAGWDVDRARPWLDVGLFDWGVASPWIAGGVGPGVASEWVREGLDFETAVAWLPTGVGPEVVRMWVGCGVEPSRAAGWWESGYRDPVVVAPLDREGCTPLEVGEWLAVGVPVEDVLDERRFWTPDVYARWSCLSGLGVGAARELSQRVGIEMVEGFLAVGADADVIVAWSGFPSLVGSGPEWLAAGVGDPNLAVTWAQHGFDPRPARGWIRFGCDVETAAELTKLGCRPDEWLSVRDVMARDGLSLRDAYLKQKEEDIW